MPGHVRAVLGLDGSNGERACGQVVVAGANARATITLGVVKDV